MNMWVVTLAALIFYFSTSIGVARGRAKYGIPAPAMTGDPDFERLVRIQANTLEWLPLFLVSLWLFAAYWDVRVATGAGIVWIIGRILYMTGYSKAAASRSTGFLVQALATGVLLFGALGRIIFLYVAHPA